MYINTSCTSYTSCTTVHHAPKRQSYHKVTVLITRGILFSWFHIYIHIYFLYVCIYLYIYVCMYVCYSSKNNILIKIYLLLPLFLYLLSNRKPWTFMCVCVCRKNKVSKTYYSLSYTFSAFESFLRFFDSPLKFCPGEKILSYDLALIVQTADQWSYLAVSEMCLIQWVFTGSSGNEVYTSPGRCQLPRLNQTHS